MSERSPEHPAALLRAYDEQLRRDAEVQGADLALDATAKALSAVAGLRYRFNDNVSFRAVAGVEHLESNVATLSHDRLVAGASLDFDFDLMRWR